MGDVQAAYDEVMREARSIDEVWASHWLLAAVKLARAWKSQCEEIDGLKRELDAIEFCRAAGEKENAVLRREIEEIATGPMGPKFTVN